jgi:hypothetical protein
MGYFADKSFAAQAMQEGAENYDPVLDEHIARQISDENMINEDNAEGGIIDIEALMETFVVDYVSQLNDAERKAFMESKDFQLMCEAGVVGRHSITRLNRFDDLTRRINLASLQMAREKGDADWEALRKNRIRERQLRERIFNKYATRVRNDAKQAQKRLVKINPAMFNMNRPIR